MEKSGMEENTAGYSMPLEEQNQRNTLSEAATLPPISLSDEHLWGFYKNAISKEIIDLMETAELWARYMQGSLLEGVELEDIWLNTYYDKACNDATEYSIHKAVRILSRCWQYGETLQALHASYLESQHSEDSPSTLFDDY